MKIDLTMLYVMIAATILVIFWLVLLIKGGDAYDDMINALDPEEYDFAELYVVGFEFINTFHINMYSTFFLKKQREIAEIRGRKYANFYLHVLVGAMLTYVITMVPLAMLIGALLRKPALIVLGVVLAFIIVYALYDDIQDKIKKRRDELMMEFPDVLTKLTLLVNTGMPLREAWYKVSDGGKGLLYEEMSITTDEMQNGVAEIDAYINFADRCALKEMRKFTAVVTQGIEKGGRELTLFLRDMSDELWEEKKSLAKQKGDAAAAKLIIPTFMIFAGILFMIMVPIFFGMSF